MALPTHHRTADRDAGPAARPRAGRRGGDPGHRGVLRRAAGTHADARLAGGRRDVVPQGAGEDLPVARLRLRRGAARTASRSSRGWPSAPKRSTSRAPRRRSTRAEERLAQPRSDVDYERARIALVKSLARLQVASRIASARGRPLKRMRTRRLTARHERRRVRCPWAVRTDPGLRRSSNEDSYCARVRPRPLRRGRRHGRPRRRRGRVARRRRNRSRRSSPKPPAPTRTAPGRSRSNRSSASRATA